MKVTINNEPLAGLLGVKPGDKVNVECKQGVPVNREWRNRFRDSVIDGCISLPVSKSKPKKEAD